MAAVTLKDLMDPLSKIEAAATETNEKLDALIAVSTGSGGGGGLDAAIMGQLQAQTALLTAIEANTSRSPMAGIFSKSDKAKKEVAGAGATLDLLGVGAKKTATGMLLWSLVPKKAVTKFTDFVTKTFETLANQNPKDVRKGIDNLDLMGGAILKFSKALALSAILLIPGMIAIPFLLASIVVMGGAMALLGALSKPINKGARSLDRMGDAITSFGIGLGLFALSTMLILMSPMILVGMVASIVLIGGAIALLGTKAFSKKIRKGSLSLALLGIALLPFSLGLVVYSKVTQKFTFMDVLIQGATILAIGTATALVGMFGISNIALGALSLALNGIGLLVFALGYTPFAEATAGMSWKDVGIQSAILVAVGGIMALAGLAVTASMGAALLGPALYAAAGGSLLLLAPGLDAMKKLNYQKKDAENLTWTLGAVAMAFSGAKPDEGFFSNLGNMFGRVLQSGGGIASAAMYGVAGVALTKLSKGLAAFKAIGFTTEDSKELAIALGSVSGAFAQAGGEPASPGGLFGAVFGNTFSPNATERGIESVMDSGKALSEITKGLAAFLDLKKSYGLDEKAFQPGGFLNVAITDTLGFLSKAFASIGGMETEDGWGPFKWDENKVEKGIDAVKGSGKALADITGGLKAFLDLRNNYGLTAESFATGGYLQVAVADTLAFVSKAFASIGGEETEDSWGPFKWDENKVEKGIDAVKGAGQELTNIATGLKSFQELVEKEIDFSKGGKLATAVKNSLSFVSTAFSAIGGMEESDGWFVFSWDENSVEKGIEAVQGAGAELSNIANGLKVFADMSATVDFSKNGALATAVKNSLTFVAGAFMKIGGMEETDGNWLFSWDENLVQKGIENVEGAGSALTDIAEGLKAFALLKNPAGIAQSIELIFTSIGDTFAKYYSNPSYAEDLDHMQGFITELSMYAEDGSLAKAATDLESIASAVNSIDVYKAESFANLFKGAGDLANNRAAYKQLATAVEEIRDLLGDQGTSVGDAVGGALDRVLGGSSGDDKKKGSDGMTRTLNKMNSTLGRLDSTMGQLPASIQSIKIVIPD